MPPQPQYYVLDDAHALTSEQTQALSTLLIEHDQATGELLMIAVLASAENSDPAARTHEIFEAWDVSRKVGGNGAVIAVFVKEHLAAIQAGYGLSTRLTDSAVKILTVDTFQALGLSTLEVLHDLESPLIENGRARALLRAAGFKNTSIPKTPKFTSAWMLWILAGAGLCIMVFTQLSAAEAHFTSSGWFRPGPMRQAVLGIKQILKSPRGKRASRALWGGSHASW